MDADCAVCRGACCEDILVPVDPEALDELTVEWLSARGEMVVWADRPHVRLRAPCPHLKDGRCGVYERRPLVCRAYVMGGDRCLETIARRRR